MGKLIHHEWDKVEGSNKLQHKQCPRCLCEKYFSTDHGQVIYVDRFGKTWFRAPKCEMTTKFNT